MRTEKLAITWQITDRHGWGIFGLNLARHLIRNGPMPPLLLTPPLLIEMAAEWQTAFAALIHEQQAIEAQLNATDQTMTSDQITVLHSLGNDFQQSPISQRVRGGANVGFVFFELGAFDSAALERARGFDRILAGSSWNRDYARAAGIDNIEFVSQGIDTELFQARPRQGTFGDRFTIFSGGKLELRKGQDLIIAAFKIFHRRHPEAVLVTNWYNSWPESASSITASAHVEAPPKIDSNGELRLTDWAVENGVSADAFIDLGLRPHSVLPSILREMDAAIFTNRCEGGTNLVAMEAMACGLPCIISANTGHLDIIGDGDCYPLGEQTPIRPVGDPAEMWRESSVEEIVANLEDIYTDREEARTRAGRAAESMKALSWDKQIPKLIAAIEDLL